MSPLQQKRFVLVVSLVLGIGSAIALVLYALSQNINLFYSPTQLVQSQADKISDKIAGKTIRVGGMVVKGSVKRQDNLALEFAITDLNETVKVQYEGILPDLFREGQGIVALGELTKEGHFKASQVLAKHDEKYMPPEVDQALKRYAKFPESVSDESKTGEG